MSADQALKDLKDKIELEKNLQSKMTKYFSGLLNEYKDNQLNPNNIFNLNNKEIELIEILDSHSEKVADKFGSDFDDFLDDEDRLTTGEKTSIALLLAMFIREQSKKAAKQITQTTARNIIQSEVMADSMLAADIAKSERVGRIDRILNSVAILSKKLAGRINTIATSETQLIAETTKHTVASKIAREPAYMEGLQARKSEINKTWWTVGDERVREAHAMAHRQTVPTNQPFIVMGESLMFPRDINLGASAENVINCRCTATYDKDDLISARKAEGL